MNKIDLNIFRDKKNESLTIRNGAAIFNTDGFCIPEGQEVSPSAVDGIRNYT